MTSHVISFTVTGLLGITAITGTFSSARAASNSLCSMIPWYGTRNANVSAFIATALPDTVEAAQGRITPSFYGGHSGSGQPRVVFGQNFSVDTVSGSSAFSRELSRSRKVVIVPWDYDAACKDTYWSRSARWVEPGLAGFFMVSIRPQSEWVNGRPTFDVVADFQPYPHGEFFKSSSLGTKDRTRSLTALEFMSLYESLPPARDTTELDALRNWVSRHPDLAKKYPANGIVARLLSARSP